MSKIRIERKEKTAYVITAESLLRLDTLMKEYCEDVHYLINSKDGKMNITFSSVQDLLNYPNGNETSIASLYVFTVTLSQPDLSVSFSREGEIGYEIKGEEETAYFLVSRFEDFKHSVRSSTARIASLDLSVFSISALITLGFAMLGSIVAILIAVSANLSMPYFLLVLYLGALCVLMPIGLIVCLVVIEILRTRLFPQCVFAIGKGLERYNNLMFWRNSVLFVGLIVGVIAGLILWVLTRSL